MHEFGLCEGVVDAVRQRAGGRRVTGVRVRFGGRHAVDEESLAQATGAGAQAGTQADVREAADEQEGMAGLNRHLDEPSQEGGAQDAEQADQGGSHRGGAGPGG